MESTTVELRKGRNLAWYHHLTHITCVKKLRGVTTNVRCTSCTNWTISFKVRGFQTKTHLLQMHFIFPNLFKLKTFCAFNMHHSKPHTNLNPSWLHLLFFMHFIIYFGQRWPWIEKHCKWTLKWLKVGMVSSFHPHSMC